MWSSTKYVYDQGGLFSTGLVGGYDIKTSLSYPVAGGLVNARAGGAVNIATAQIDVKAPGAQDQLTLPPLPYTSQNHRGSQFDPSHHRAPVTDYNTPGWLYSESMNRRATEIWKLCHSTEDHFTMRDMGTYSVPYTGFSRLGDIKPRSTMGYI
jgi:hypothetical protein